MESHNAQYFLNLIKKSRRGRFKVYIGMIAGVGKTYRMLQEAHALLRNGIDVKVGYVETHGRAETAALLEGLPVIPRRSLFYKGKELEEFDLQAVLNQHPEVVIVDELAHSNIEGSQNSKRWQDVLALLDAGINVISALNIQHIESLNEEVRKITGIEVRERVPDKVIALADDVVNIDLPADELITRLKEGKIYPSEKIQTALNNFFQSDYILQLRELALKEVAGHVERKVDTEVLGSNIGRNDSYLACVSSNHIVGKKIIRKVSRMSSFNGSKWYLLYVQTPEESGDKIALSTQRHLINNFKLAIELGGEVIKNRNSSVIKGILDVAEKKNITTICVGKPKFRIRDILFKIIVFRYLLKRLSVLNIDLIMVS